jgi:hypothetical protein
MWGLLNDMSFLSMISISIPGIGKILQSALYLLRSLADRTLAIPSGLRRRQWCGRNGSMYFDENG